MPSVVTKCLEAQERYPWLGKMPETWEVLPLRRVFDLVTEKAISDVFPVALENISSWTAEYIPTESTFEAEGIGFQKGDVLFGKLRPYLAKALLADQSGEAVGDIHVLRPVQGIDGRFAIYQILERNFISIIDGSTYGAKMPRVGWAFLAAMPWVLPPNAEQRTIADFLDRETGKIDLIIHKQERLIALLGEKRQAVISHAVTKGLDPSVPMQDSGIEWIGQVPKHWRLSRLRFIAKLNPSKSEIGEQPELNVSFLPMEAIGDDGTLMLNQTRPVSEVFTGYTYFRDNDVTIAKITPCFENGKGAVMRNLCSGLGFGTTELIVVRPETTKVLSQYLYWLFRSTQFRRIGEGHMYGAGGQKRVPDDFVRDYYLGVPGLPEQGKICEFLEEELSKIDVLNTKAQQSIGLIRERRAALISAAVTGKIDVRGVA